MAFKQRVILKFERGERSQWTSHAPMLYHLEALLSLWMYSFLYEDEPSIHYFDAGITLAAWLEMTLKDRVSEDYFSIIGLKAAKDQLICLGVAPQNIVELGGENDQLNVKQLPRDYIPLFTDFQRHDNPKTGPKKDKQEQQDIAEWNSADFTSRDHLFGISPDLHNHKGPIYAYKHPSSPVIKTNELLSKSEQRKFLKSTLEALFVQQIYSAVIRSLVAFGKDDGDFVLDRDECDFLARTYMREKLGARESALVCLGPAWKHAGDHTHSLQHECGLEKEEKEIAAKEQCTAFFCG